jgi:hypothetical protein
VKVLYKLYDRFHTWLYADSASPTTWHRATPEDRAKTAPLTQSHEEWFADVSAHGACGSSRCHRIHWRRRGVPRLSAAAHAWMSRVAASTACRPYERKALIGIRHDIHPRMFLPTLCHEMAHLLRGHRGYFCVMRSSSSQRMLKRKQSGGDRGVSSRWRRRSGGAFLEADGRLADRCWSGRERVMIDLILPVL